jgi:hypothetical protein
VAKPSSSPPAPAASPWPPAPFAPPFSFSLAVAQVATPLLPCVARGALFLLRLLMRAARSVSAARVLFLRLHALLSLAPQLGPSPGHSSQPSFSLAGACSDGVPAVRAFLSARSSVGRRCSLRPRFLLRSMAGSLSSPLARIPVSRAHYLVDFSARGTPSSFPCSRRGFPARQHLFKSSRLPAALA